MAWTVEQIVTLFRDLTGRKNANQISDVNILIEINHYYQHLFPLEADIREFKGWYIFNTADGTGYQDLPESVLGVSYPAYVDDTEIVLWTNEQKFYEDYPHDYTTEGLPTDVLLLDRQLIMRPIPDDVYSARFRKTSSIPDALTSGDLDNSIYGPAIGYGAAIMFQMAKGEKEIAEEHGAGYQYHLRLCRKHNILQMPVGRRPRGGRF